MQATLEKLIDFDLINDRRADHHVRLPRRRQVGWIEAVPGPVEPLDPGVRLAGDGLADLDVVGADRVIRAAELVAAVHDHHVGADPVDHGPHLREQSREILRQCPNKDAPDDAPALRQYLATRRGLQQHDLEDGLHVWSRRDHAGLDLLQHADRRAVW